MSRLPIAEEMEAHPMLDLAIGFSLGFGAALIPPVRDRVIAVTRAAVQYLRRAFTPKE